MSIMTLQIMEIVLRNVSFPKAKFVVHQGLDSPWLQIEMEGFCNVTGEPKKWRGRKWRLSTHMTKSELVQTAFLAIMTAMEHETREQFRYKGSAVFGPHYNIERLATLASEPGDVR